MKPRHPEMTRQQIMLCLISEGKNRYPELLLAFTSWLHDWINDPERRIIRLFHNEVLKYRIADIYTQLTRAGWIKPTIYRCEPRKLTTSGKELVEKLTQSGQLDAIMG